MGVIFLLSSQPSLPQAPHDLLDLLLKKLSHLGEYLVLGLLVVRALVPHGSVPRAGLGLALLICLMYAVSDEIHQARVPGRGPSVIDVVIDLVGAAIGVGAFAIRRQGSTP